mmetsp:Transcript_35246/g.91584  ORF Transcript_35246/g.91584 Transcript_35246/m.91584 type:complete len:725 (-) Transcript_35246:873-3047(-)
MFAESVLVDDVHDCKLERVHPHVPDEAPDPCNQHIPSTADYAGLMHALGVGNWARARVSARHAQKRAGAEVARGARRPWCGVAVEAKAGDEGGSCLRQCKRHEQDGCRHAGEGVLLGADHEDESHAGDGDVGVHQSAQHRLADPGDLCNALLHGLGASWVSGPLAVEGRKVGGAAGRVHPTLAKTSRACRAIAHVEQLQPLSHLWEGVCPGGQVEEDDGGDCLDEAVRKAEGEHLGEEPGVRHGAGCHEVLGEGDHGSIIEDGKEHNQERRKVPVINDCDEAKGEADADGDGNGVLGVRLHALEDLAGSDDGIDDDAQPWLGEHHVGRRTGSVSGVRHRDANITFLEGRRIVHAVACHAADVPTVLKPLHNLVLVLWENFRKAVRLLDQLVQRNASLHQAACHAGLNDIRGVHVGAHPKLARSLHANGKLVTGDHLDANAQSVSLLDGELGVVAGRVKQWDEAHELPLGDAIRPIALCNSHTKGAVAARRVLQDALLHLSLDLWQVVRQAEHHLRCALGHAEAGVDTIRCRVGLGVDESNGALVGRVEGAVLEAFVAVPEGVLPVVRVVQADINGLVALNARTERGVEEDVLRDEPALGLEVGLVHRQLVEGECAGLVGAQHVHACHLLDRRQPAHDGALLSQLVGAKCQSHREHGGHCNGDTTHDDDEHVGEGRAASFAWPTLVLVHPKLHSQLNDDPEQNGDHACEADGGHDLLQMTGLIAR